MEKTSDAAPQIPAAVAAAPVKNEPRRDIVMGMLGDSTEALIKRCRALGWIEGELCRIRVCSGLWGTAPGCATAASEPPYR